MKSAPKGRRSTSPSDDHDGLMVESQIPADQQSSVSGFTSDNRAIRQMLVYELVELGAKTRIICELTGLTVHKVILRRRKMLRTSRGAQSSWIWYKTPIRMTQATNLLRRYQEAASSIKNEIDTAKVMIAVYRDFVRDMSQYDSIENLDFNHFYYLLRHVRHGVFVRRRCSRCHSEYLDDRDEINTECYCCRAVEQSSCCVCGNPLPFTRGLRPVRCQSCRDEGVPATQDRPANRYGYGNRSKIAKTKTEGLDKILRMMSVHEPSLGKAQSGSARRHRP
jgi:hypothetical protein